MNIEMLAAKHGDCFLVHGGSDDDPALILIDGGPVGVWKSALERRLIAIRQQRGLADDRPLIIDLLIISHVDDDHINGVAAMLNAMLQRNQDGDPPLFQIKRIWHNSFDNILGNDETVAVIKTAGAQFGPASNEADRDQVLEPVEEGSAKDAAFVLASIAQGDNVRRLAKALNIPLNPDFGGKLITTTPGQPATVTIGDLQLTIAGPRREEVVALQKKHDVWLKKHPERQADADAILAALDDESVANLSSIVILLEAGGRKVLLTGDARGDRITQGLEDCGAVSQDGVLPLDILKMPHHGSIRNIDAKMIERLPADRYLFSANGKYSNPDRETFELLFKVRPAAQMKFILAYDLEEIEKGRKRTYDAKKKPGDGEWNEDAQGLKPILAPPPPGVEIAESDGISITVTP